MVAGGPVFRSIAGFVDFVHPLKYLASDPAQVIMSSVKYTLLVLLLGGLMQVSAQERPDTRKEQEKKKEEQKRTEEPAVRDESTLRKASPRQFLRDNQPQGRDIPVPERGSEQTLQPSGSAAAQAEEVRKVFNMVEDGLAESSIGRFSPHFGSQVTVSLRGGENGMYSANQAYYVLENYIRNRRLVDFSFNSVSEFGPNPYATGSAGFASRSGKESAQVYVALARAGSRWVITQINIY
jgi:hypothetical protein